MQSSRLKPVPRESVATTKKTGIAAGFFVFAEKLKAPACPATPCLARPLWGIVIRRGTGFSREEVGTSDAYVATGMQSSRLKPVPRESVATTKKPGIAAGFFVFAEKLKAPACPATPCLARRLCRRWWPAGRRLSGRWSLYVDGIPPASSLSCLARHDVRPFPRRRSSG